MCCNAIKNVHFKSAFIWSNKTIEIGINFVICTTCLFNPGQSRALCRMPESLIRLNLLVNLIHCHYLCDGCKQHIVKSLKQIQKIVFAWRYFIWSRICSDASGPTVEITLQTVRKMRSDDGNLKQDSANKGDKSNERLQNH